MTLTETLADRTFDLNVAGQYSRVEDRWNHPHLTTHNATTIVPIPVVSLADAPVAFDVHGKAVRVHGGDLYVAREVLGKTVLVGSRDFTGEAQYSPFSAANPEEWTSAAHHHFAQLLIVDFGGGREEVWTRTGEPRYVIRTFAPGYEYEGTHVTVAFNDDSKIEAGAYFRADDFAGAHAYATFAAARRGDADSLTRLSETKPGITVHRPDAVRLVIGKSESPAVGRARRDLKDAARRYVNALREGPNAVEAEDWDVLVRAREHLASLTGDIVGDGVEKRPYEDR